MVKVFWVLIGLILFGGAIGILGYRFAKEPDLVTKYEQIIVQQNKPAPTIQNAPQTRSATPQPDFEATSKSTEELSAKQQSSKSFGTVKALEIALDVGNILVGLIGIYLAVSAMRRDR